MYIGSLDSGRDYVRTGVSQARPRRTASLQERLLENGGSPRTRVGERRFSGVALGRTAVSRGFAWRTVVLPTSFSENRCSPITGLGWQVYLAPSTRISLTASWARPPQRLPHQGQEARMVHHARQLANNGAVLVEYQERRGGRGADGKAPEMRRLRGGSGGQANERGQAWAGEGGGPKPAGDIAWRL